MRYLKVLLLLFPFCVFSQSKNLGVDIIYPIDQHQCKSSFAKVKLMATDNAIEQVQTYLLSHIENLQLDKMGLKLLSDIESPAARHITFQQTCHSIPVYTATVKVNLNKQGNIISLFDNSFKADQALSAHFASQQIIDSYIAAISPEAIIKWESNYYYSGEELIPAIKFEIYESASKYYEQMMDAQGEIIYHKDLLKYNKPSNANNILSDSMVSANVFLPDPLTTAAVTYGSPYADNSDADAGVLTSQLVNINITVSYTAGTFFLEGPYAIIKDIESPSVAAATSTTPDFSFTRSQNGFEDVSAYYHINVQQAHLQSLGFTNLVNYAINVDAHAWNGADQSSFSGMGTSSQLLFGEGGVDDAEDADVILHEYGHAILHSASPFATSGNEMNAIDEGNGDYFAASYSRNISSYNWQDVFSWDGHNEFWSGRVVETTKHYPDDMVGNLYTDAPLWSSTLMEIWGDIGVDTTDQLLLQSMYSFSSGMSMTDAATLYLQSDTLLYGGSHGAAIYNRMCSRGFLGCSTLVNEIINHNNSEISLLNSLAFMMGNKGSMLRWLNNSDAVIKLYSSDGKLVFSDKREKINEYELPQLHLTSGIYVLKVFLPAHSTCFKMVKY